MNRSMHVQIESTRHRVTWRWAGELWMSGPEWGWISINSGPEQSAGSPEVVWAADESFMAFVSLKVDDVPNRKGTEGMGFRIGLVRMSDGAIRYCLGNVGLADIRLSTMSADSIQAVVEGKVRTIPVDNISWD
ncbi:hypothetical protein [Pandoraea sputorum]|uniref:hypothetical protein n=1 Tax=Pandoraea sputorum TaxID=93222 RepID=UPI002F40BA98